MISHLLVVVINGPIYLEKEEILSGPDWTATMDELI